MTFIKNLFIAHVRNLVATLGSIYRKPIGSIVIIFIIGVILSLPLLGYVVIKSLDQTNTLLSKQLTIHVYLKDNLNQDQIITLQQQIDDLGIMKTINFMSKETSLSQFDSELINLLPDNPLPDMLVLTIDDPRNLTVDLINQISSLTNVEMIDNDLSWINNLTNIIKLVKTLTMILGTLLIITVSIMITNTIKLLLERQREQIKINRLIGATTGFILREFMYYGFWYGFLGSILAMSITTACTLATKLAIIKFFGDSINLPWYFLSIENILSIIATASFLGLFSAAFSITDQLRKIEY